MHTGGRRGAPYVPPQKNLKIFYHKNAIKHKNRGPLDFLTIPSTPAAAPSKEFANDCASMK
jgi:hypothetical protein